MSHVETVTDRLQFRSPFFLKIDEEERLIDEPTMLVNVREHIAVTDELDEVVHVEGAPFQGTVMLLVNGRVVIAAGYTRKGPPVCYVIKNPDDTYTVQFFKSSAAILL